MENIPQEITLYEDLSKWISDEESKLNKHKKELKKYEVSAFHALTDNKFEVGTLFDLGTEFQYKVMDFKVELDYCNSDFPKRIYVPFVMSARVNKKTGDFVGNAELGSAYWQKIAVKRIKNIIKH